MPLNQNVSYLKSFPSLIQSVSIQLLASNIINILIDSKYYKQFTKSMIASAQQPDVIQTKKIYNLMLNFPPGYPPYHQVNPYVLLAELNKIVREKYDMQIVHVRYAMDKNKDQKDLNEHYINLQKFQVDRTTNNIFSTETASQFFRDKILFDAVRLRPPVDYNPAETEEQFQNQFKAEEDQRLKKLKGNIETVMGFCNDPKIYKENKDTPIPRTIQSFKKSFNQSYFKSCDMKIYAKAMMNPPVYQKLCEDSQKRDKKNELSFKWRQNFIKVYLNPTKDLNSYQVLNTQYRINNWSLNAYHQDNFTTYFGTEELRNNMAEYNNAINFVSSVSFCQSGSRVDSFAIMAFMWNQIVMKIVVKMVQIHKIQKVVKGNQYEYYFHLKYPPMFYINQLKQDQANSQKFMKFPDRVTNFTFVQNQKIKNNHFLRFFLFNNSILKINLIVNDALLGGDYLPVAQAQKKLDNLFQIFKGTVKTQIRQQFYKSNFTKLKFLSQKMDFRLLNTIKMAELSKQDQDKLWIIKYLILVLIRYNYIIPTQNQIGEIIKCIQNNKKQNLDCYMYVLWKIATSLQGYSVQKTNFQQFFFKQCEQVKKMNVKDIMQRIMYSSESIVYIFRASMTPSGILFNPPSPQMKGRLLKQFVNYSQFFLRVSLCQQSQIELKNQKYITRMYFRELMNEIVIFSRLYDPLGWSPSQLRSFSLWYFHKVGQRKKQQVIQRLQRRHILNFLGEFSDIENPAKKAARIGQSFSSSWTFSAKNIKYKVIDDIYSSQNLNFTDGIGKISQDLLSNISLELKIRQLTVIQVRYLGAKGVLVLDPSLGKNQIHLRKSMIKFPCQDKNALKYLDILDWNKYKPGFLNRQIIILLKTLKIDNLVFSRIQQQHINRIQKMTFKDCSIFKYMGEQLTTQITNLQPANKTILSLINAGFELEKQPFFRGVLQTLKKNGYYQLKVKCNIQIQKSARIIGIVDQDGILQENEVYCGIFDHFAHPQVRDVVQGPAIITRNPCLHPADIRVVTCVGKKQVAERFAKVGKKNKFQQLWNVVIMPMKGKYPLTSQISGSDLDGDNFFICWDDRLIPTQTYPPVILDQPSASATKKKQIKGYKNLGQKQTYSKMLDFFIDYTNYQKLGQIDNSHLVHADKDLNNYAGSDICLKLALIHGKAVDFPKTGYCPPVSPQLFVSTYPDFMQKQNANSYISESILGKLYRDIKNKIQTLLQNQVYHNVTQIDKTLIFNYVYDQSYEQVKQCLKNLRQYQREMTNLIRLLGVDSQYQIYSGNFSAVKTKLKMFGKNRLIASIMGLRERFSDVFFQRLSQDKQKYKNTSFQQKHMKTPKYFSDQARRQAQIYYLISYIRKFPDIKQQSQGFNKLKQKINRAMQQLKIINIQQLYCGFVWFVVPKIILNLKITWRDAQIPQKDKEGQEMKNFNQDGEQFI